MTTALARKFAVDVTADLTLEGGFIRLNGVNDLDPEITPNLEDASDYDTDGWASSEPTMQAWTLASTFFRRLTSGVYDPGQELIRARIGQFGDNARIGVRWYDRNGGPEAYSGIAIPAWKRSNTAVKNLEQAQVTFTGTDVPLNLDIDNPSAGGIVPVISAVSSTPGVQVTGGLVRIDGAGFTGFTAVKFAAVSATEIDQIADGVLVVKMPSGSAGAAAVTVITPAGTSNAFPYTRGA